MAVPERLAGVLSPVVTPFKDDLSPDPERFVQHCRWLLSQNVNLAVFGTTSEANSLSVEEKISLLDQLVDAGIESSRLLSGTGHCALTDTVKLTAHAVSLGCAGMLMLPPFYYKDVSDDGLYRSFAEVIERVGSDDLRVYLYHIPPIAHVGIPPHLVERLVTQYPKTVVGIKDSSGDWDNTDALLQLGLDDFRVFAGSETFLLQNMRGGGAGCISATANINPAAIHELYENWQSEKAETMQADLDAVRSTVQKYPMIPALKSILGNLRGEAQWETVRPPLLALADDHKSELLDALHELGFQMPGLID
ncbi:MAG: dihydrodipicolinate synthase family protein [Proteobacteria bacterium]|jgi:4-hydroxy-tetrahydrodipicolinate synthase|nr:dihydrodipicolinate synthase family protein [Pseudomonadota bacterium]